MDTLDALRICILSKRMLKLPTMLSQIAVNIGNLAARVDTCAFGIREVVRINGAVVDVLENILSTRRPEITIRKLHARFVLRHYDCLSIGKSFARAMATQKVEKAEIEIMAEKSNKDCASADLIRFAKLFNTFLGACPDAFAGLTRLWLQNMRFGEEDIPNMLSTCKRLESLRFSFCDTGICSRLKLQHDQLVELEIDYGHFEIIDLSCLPKLQRVSYNNWFPYEDHPLSFGFVPRLSKISLYKTGVCSDRALVLSRLLATFLSLSELHLDFRSEKIWVLPECPKLLVPLLGKLRLVNLDNLPEGCDIAWTMFILEAAPSLKELCITVWDHCMEIDKERRKARGLCDKANVEWKPSASDFKHKNLAKLTIYGFLPDDNFMRYIRRVLEAAVNIKEISLHNKKVCEDCSGLDPKINVCSARYPQSDEERKHVMKELGMSWQDVIHFQS
ncbi:hypothetical protein BRADI_4g13590v3 [Brachypodium distachyon]|nr:hypothetical protein BRADI_4g13590v3 [Brachypodium distachyon]